MLAKDVVDTKTILNNASPNSFNKAFVKSITNSEATSTNIKETLNTFFKSAKPEDQITIFLAGHGVLDENLDYYFAPYDMDFNNVIQNGIAFNTLIESLKQSPSNNKLLLMDSCHSGNTLDIDDKTKKELTTTNTPGQRGSKAKTTTKSSKFKLSDVVSSIFQDFLSQSGVTVISASSGADVAFENESIGNGAFTSAYLDYLKRSLGGFSFNLSEKNLKTSLQLKEDDISQILKQVMTITNGKQTPDLREFNTTSDLKMW